MFVKRYIVNNMAEAMEKIKRDLGKEAVILSNRPIRPKGLFGFLKKRMYEITVAYEPSRERSLGIEVGAGELEPAQKIVNAPSLERTAKAEEEKHAGAKQAEPLDGKVMEHSERSKGPRRFEDALKALSQPEIPPVMGEEPKEEMEFRSYDQTLRKIIPQPFVPAAQELLKEQKPFAPPQIVATEPKIPQMQSPQTLQVPQVAFADATQQIEQLSARLQEVKHVVADLTAKVSSVDVLPQRQVEFGPEINEIYRALVDCAVHEDIARDICQRVKEVSQRVNDPLHQIVEVLLTELIGEPDTLRFKKYQQNIIMLVGPTGVGKTTTLVKLAGMYAIEHSMKVGFINTDTYKIAAQEQLKTYADILDIPCVTVYTPEEMAAAIDELRDCDVIFIDTAGKSTRDKQYHDDIRQFATHGKVSEILLTIPSSLSWHESKAIFNNYSFLDSYKLIITKTDEMSFWGNVVNLVWLAKKPVAFFTVGQNVPQDIEVPDPVGIAKKLLEGNDA